MLICLQNNLHICHIIKYTMFYMDINSPKVGILYTFQPFINKLYCCYDCNTGHIMLFQTLYIEHNILTVWCCFKMRILSLNWYKIKMNSWKHLYFCIEMRSISFFKLNANIYSFNDQFLSKWQMNIKTMKIFTTNFVQNPLPEITQKWDMAHNYKI